MYKLDELTSVPELRSNVAKMFRMNAGVKTAETANLLVYKGREELEVSGGVLAGLSLGLFFV
jgi:hypothetical protein